MYGPTHVHIYKKPKTNITKVLKNNDKTTSLGTDLLTLAELLRTPCLSNRFLQMRWGVQVVWWQWDLTLEWSVRLHCCIFFPWHQTSGKVLYNFTFP